MLCVGLQRSEVWKDKHPVCEQAAAAHNQARTSELEPSYCGQGVLHASV